MRAGAFEVQGVVQGVGFRYFSLRAARRLGLAGWVRNRKDGAVEGWVQGAEASLNDFLQKLRQGPPFSRVDQVEFFEKSPRPDLSEFLVLD